MRTNILKQLGRQGEQWDVLVIGGGASGLGAAVEAVRGYVHAASAGHAPDQIALASKLTMSGLMLIYVFLCVRSFINARLAGKV